MTGSTSSAEPKKLHHYSESAIRIDLDLLATSHRLAGILHQFEATCTEPGFRVHVSHVADGMGGHARSAKPVDRWVNIVERGFRMADSRALPPYIRILLTAPAFGNVTPSLTPLGRLMGTIQREEFPNLFPMPVVLPSPIETPGIHANPHALNGAFNNANSALSRALHSIRRLIFALRFRRFIDRIRRPPWFHWPWPRLSWPDWPTITIPEGLGAWWRLLPFIPGTPWLAPKPPAMPSPTPISNESIAKDFEDFKKTVPPRSNVVMWPTSRLLLRFTEPQQITEHERSLLDKLNIGEKIAFRDIYKKAMLLGGGSHNGQKDALRHAVGAALLTRRFGTSWAKEYTNAHEEKPENPTAEEFMDRHNNDLGIRLASQYPDLSENELIDKVTEAIRDGYGIYIPGEYNPSTGENGPLSPTNSGE